jgi:hypothetical protein
MSAASLNFDQEKQPRCSGKKQRSQLSTLPRDQVAHTQHEFRAKPVQTESRGGRAAALGFM